MIHKNNKHKYSSQTIGQMIYICSKNPLLYITMIQNKAL